MTRTHARAPAGLRAVDAVPKNWGDNIPVTAALTLDGIVAPMMLYGSMNSRAFEAYVEQCLAPELLPGDVVVLDNLRAHKTDRVRDLVEATGARLMYLPVVGHQKARKSERQVRAAIRSHIGSLFAGKTG